MKGEPMKYTIFLDIDGVLNTPDDPQEHIWDHTGWGVTQLINLQHILDSFPANETMVVISSTWRKIYELYELMGMFCDSLERPPKYLDRTPAKLGFRKRGDEIHEYIECHNVDRFVIIDDDNDMRDYQQAVFVRTNPEFGLTWDDAIYAVDILESWDRL